MARQHARRSVPEPASGIPDDRAFAFSLFDDTDVSTLQGIRPVYDFLRELGFRTTKTVWCFDHDGPSSYQGSHTLAHDDYREYVLGLARDGFEIAFHGASMESSARERTAAALERFREVFGQYPRCYAAHAQNRENLYWGRDRLVNPLVRRAYALLARGEADVEYGGHRPQSDFYWADLARAHLTYVRNFTYRGLDLTTVPGPLAYHDAAKPQVRRWFHTADADNVEEFNHLLRPANQERLVRRRGVAIVSTHLGKGFVRRGQLDAGTARLLEQLANRGGWLVPVGELLDRCAATGVSPIASWTRTRLEMRWLRDAVLRKLLDRRGYDAVERDYLGSGAATGDAETAASRSRAAE